MVKKLYLSLEIILEHSESTFNVFSETIKYKHQCKIREEAEYLLVCVTCYEIFNTKLIHEMFSVINSFFSFLLECEKHDY